MICVYFLVWRARGFDLMRREVDIAISVRPHPSKSVVSREIAGYKLVMACHQSLLQDETPPEIHQVNLVSYLDDQLIDPSLKPKLEVEPVGNLLSNSIMVQWAWICAGAGVGLVHDFAQASQKEVVRIYPEYDQERAYFMTRLKSLTDDERLKALEALLAEEIRSEIYAHGGA